MAEGAAEATVPQLMVAAQECIDEWEGLPFPLEVSADHEVRFRVGFPLVSHALNHVTIALETFERFPLVAAGSARVALEHALAAQWVLWTHEGPETLVKHMEAGYLMRTKAFADAIRDQPDLTQFVDEADLVDFDAVVAREPAPGGERSWSMQQVFNRFADTGLFFDIYRELSGAVHPSFATLTTYMDLTSDDGRRSSLSKAGRPVSSHTAAQATTLAGVFALDFLERCQVVPPDPSPAATVAARVHLPYDLSASDQRPDLQRGS